MRCGGGSSGFTIQYNGRMSPCAGLSELCTQPLQEGFLLAWRKLNQLAEDYLMPEECVTCAYRRVCLVCPAMHKSAHPGHCAPQICQKTKQLIAAGLFRPPFRGGEGV